MRGCYYCAKPFETDEKFFIVDWTSPQKNKCLFHKKCLMKMIIREIGYFLIFFSCLLVFILLLLFIKFWLI
ncbi:hypothetical protein SCLARK_00412 [Spiroplasma clarkii]|uniref:Uncharacterized protein n=1 Tax=Spiroplasma clarkii TaxID=2139 RepID=A0A1Y0KZF4_9MOLU|nr:hypothetical protein SCLARK_00412 [Spiroplasma clarkii]ATX70578.1 hypothetical protein SCLAR_v1c02480 [Spiroplasma clarkii]